MKCLISKNGLPPQAVDRHQHNTIILKMNGLKVDLISILWHTDKAPILSVDFEPNSNRFATGGADNHVKVRKKNPTTNNNYYYCYIFGLFSILKKLFKVLFNISSFDSKPSF
jgi:WD40 repeat protein